MASFITLHNVKTMFHCFPAFFCELLFIWEALGTPVTIRLKPITPCILNITKHGYYLTENLENVIKDVVSSIVKDKMEGLNIVQRFVTVLGC